MTTLRAPTASAFLCHVRTLNPVPLPGLLARGFIKGRSRGSQDASGRATPGKGVYRVEIARVFRKRVGVADGRRVVGKHSAGDLEDGQQRLKSQQGCFTCSLQSHSHAFGLVSDHLCVASQAFQVRTGPHQEADSLVCHRHCSHHLDDEPACRFCRQMKWVYEIRFLSFFSGRRETFWE